jgi:hypothetical protein
VSFSEAIQGPVRQLCFVVVLPDGTIVEPSVLKTTVGEFEGQPARRLPIREINPSEFERRMAMASPIVAEFDLTSLPTSQHASRLHTSLQQREELKSLRQEGLLPR